MSEIKINTLVECKIKKENTKYESAVIEEIKKRKGEENLYYVHYLNFDRRVDQWVDESYFDMSRLKNAETGNYNLVSYKKTIRTRNTEKKFRGLAHENENDHHHHHGKSYPKNFEEIIIGKYEVGCWYFSPFSQEIMKSKKKVLICEYCLKYFGEVGQFKRHCQKCKMFSPPGNEIYRDSEHKLSFWEVNGSFQKLYSQNLCLIAKLFLEEKNIYLDVFGFVFYILTENDEKGSHILGYFSKEKNSDNNLSCICVLPQYQNRGYGKYIIDFSYKLAMKENMIGGPERPLSDLGALSYYSYWRFTILELFKRNDRGSLSIKEISLKTGMTIQDILDTLEKYEMIKHHKGKQIISISKKMIEEHEKKAERIRLRADINLIHHSKFKYNFKYLDIGNE